jgi:hypothetical protein
MLENICKLWMTDLTHSKDKTQWGPFFGEKTGAPPKFVLPD